SMTWQQVQKDVDATAQRWAQSNDAVAASYDHLLDKTGNVESAKKMNEAAAEAALANKKPMELMSKLAGDLAEKFEISAQDMRASLAQVAASGRLDVLAATMHEVGAASRAMGMTGTEGLTRVMGMIELSKRGVKDVQAVIGGLKQLNDAL